MDSESIFLCFLSLGCHCLLSALFQSTCNKLSSPVQLILVLVECLYSSDSQLWLHIGIAWKHTFFKKIGTHTNPDLLCLGCGLGIRIFKCSPSDFIVLLDGIPLPNCVSTSLRTLLLCRFWFSWSRIRAWDPVLLTNSWKLQILLVRGSLWVARAWRTW